ncbi:hypothetical protein OROHE_001425 [Orobanche hederae]
MNRRHKRSNKHHECDSVTAYFNACQPGDIMNVTFVATGTLSLPKHIDPKIIKVFPWTDTWESGVPPETHLPDDLNN